MAVRSFSTRITGVKQSVLMLLPISVPLVVIMRCLWFVHSCIPPLSLPTIAHDTVGQIPEA